MTERSAPLTGLRVAADASAAAGRAARMLTDLGAERVDGLPADVALRGDGPPGVPAPVTVALPTFAADDPRSGEVLDAAALAHLAGVYDPPVGRARPHPLAVAEVVAASYGAVAAVAAAWAVERGAAGRAVEVARLDAGLHALELHALLRLDPPPRWSTLAWAASPFVQAWRCADGRWVFVHLGLPKHLARFRAWLAAAGDPLEVSDATASDPLTVGSVREAWRLRRALGARFARRAAAEWEDTLSGLGLCAAVCRTAAEWAAHPQPLADGQLAPDGALGPPVRVAPGGRGPERPPAAHGAPPLAGVRVLDLSRVIAGPIAGRTLAALGAEVTKVVDPAETQGWVEAFRAGFDGGKRVAPLDLRTASGRSALRALLDQPFDVLLHNLRPEAAARLGLLDGRRPPVVAAISAYGTRGPWAGRPGWEQTAQAVVGTQLEYGAERGGRARPELVPLPATDLTAGLFCALGVVSALRAGSGEVEATLTSAQLHLRRDAPRAAPARALALRARLGQRPGMIARVARPGLGTLTEVALPWRGPGLAATLPGTGALPGAPGDRPPLRRAAHLARWGAFLAWTRLRP